MPASRNDSDLVCRFLLERVSALCLHQRDLLGAFGLKAPFQRVELHENCQHPADTVAFTMKVFCHAERNSVLTNPILVFRSLLNLIKPFLRVPFTQKLMSILPCNWLISPLIHGILLAKYISSPNICLASAFVRSAYMVLVTTELDCF